MMKKKIIGIVVVLMLFGGGVYYLKYRQAPKNDLLTLSPRVGNATASSEFLNAQRAVSFYRDEIAKHPDIIKNYVELAQLFLQEGRVTGRHHEYVPKAQSLLDEALKRDPNNYDANIIKASMLLTMHQFMQAKEIAERMVTKSPHTAIGYGVLCDALVELGEYEHAVEACDEMLKARPDLRSYSRASYLRELHGDLAGAIEAMQLAAETGIAGQENRAWALYNLGKLFLNAGKLDTAAYIFNGILEERPAYAYALSGLAMVNKVRGTYDKAIELLSKASQSMPEHIFLEQLADVYLSDGQKENAEGVAKIVMNAFEQHEKGGWNINREYAMFCANHNMNLSEALDRAKKEYDLRPTNIDVLDTYAWTLYKNGKASEAVPFIEQAMHRNTANFMLHYHASLIFAAAGQQEKAEIFRKQSMKENPFVHALVADGDEPYTAVAKKIALR